jgi:hypothetical protein
MNTQHSHDDLNLAKIMMMAGRKYDKKQIDRKTIMTEARKSLQILADLYDRLFGSSYDKSVARYI